MIHLPLFFLYWAIIQSLSKTIKSKKTKRAKGLMRFFLIFIIFCLNITLPALGQGQKAAQKLLYKAQTYKSTKDTARAYRYATLALVENPSYDEAYTTLGQWYYDARYFLRSARLFKNACQKCLNGFTKFSLAAARSYLYAQQPDSALYFLNESQNHGLEAKKIEAQARMLLSMRVRKDTNEVRKLSSRINSKFSEFFPSLSSDGQTLYFTRRVNGVNEDFFYALPDSCGDWYTARNLGYPPNTAAQESAQTISSDDHYLFFMRSDNRSENGWGRGGCDLYLAYRKSVDKPWSVAESFGATINTPAFEGMPSLSPDINDLYFVSDRPGGYGGLDIWLSHFKFGLWQYPINLGPQINTAGNETAPFISSDNRTLYFSSDGHLGLGGGDLFMSKKIADSIWEQPQNLGTPINSPTDDNSIFVCANGKNALFASDRGNEGGHLDIYETILPKRSAPEVTAFALCYVLDSLSKAPATMGSITLYDSLGNEMAQYHANKGDGSILMSLPLNQTFSYSVRAYNCTSSEGTINFPEACPKWCELTFALLPRDYVKPTKDSLVLTVHFAKNVITLNDTQIVAIESTLREWMGKEDLAIFVNSYTDNTGTPLINTEKSTIRANVISHAIGKMGFEPQIISATGFGESSPVAPNDSPENQNLNRRVEIVLHWSY